MRTSPDIAVVPKNNSSQALISGEVALRRVTAPTLLIVGGADYGVIELNQQADALLNCEKKLILIPGATRDTFV